MGKFATSFPGSLILQTQEGERPWDRGFLSEQSSRSTSLKGKASHMCFFFLLARKTRWPHGRRSPPDRVAWIMLVIDQAWGQDRCRHWPSSFLYAYASKSINTAVGTRLISRLSGWTSLVKKCRFIIFYTTKKKKKLPRERGNSGWCVNFLLPSPRQATVKGVEGGFKCIVVCYRRYHASTLVREVK